MRMGRAGRADEEADGCGAKPCHLTHGRISLWLDLKLAGRHAMLSREQAISISCRPTSAGIAKEYESSAGRPLNSDENHVALG
jgi:hypothetical protein